MKLQLFSPDLLLEKLVFLDGLTRAGKCFLGNIVSNFQKIEFFQFNPQIDHLPILNHLKCLDENVTISLLRLNVNMSVYHQAIGRSLNGRTLDSSSINHATDVHRYLERTKKPDGIVSINNLKTEGRIPSFLTHQCLPHIELFFKTFPNSLMINIKRHPIDVAHSWYKRGWGERFGIDPLAFNPVVHGQKRPIPWFAMDWSSEYEEMEPVDRVIQSICTLSQLDMNAYHNTRFKDQILLISYEQIMSNPDLVIGEMCQFLDTEPLSNMQKVLEKQNCPRHLPLEERKEKLIFLREHSNNQHVIDYFLETTIKYEKQLDLESCW